MSEAINKVISNLPQAFTTAEQAQARQNIDAQKSIAYSYSGGTITAIDGSAVGTTGGITGIYHDSNLSGNATSSSPLGLHSAMVIGMSSTQFGENSGSAFIGEHTYLYPNRLGEQGYARAPVFGVKENDSAASIHNSTAFVIAHTANGIGSNVATSTYGGNGWYIRYSNEGNFIREVRLTNSGNHYSYLGNTAKESIYGFGSALFTDDRGTTWETVDASSIRRWNEQPAYTPYQIKIYKPTSASVYLTTADYPKFPSTADGVFVIMNLGEAGTRVTYPDSSGATAIVGANQSAQLIWDSQASQWVHWNN